jgi:hypothetical protein
MNQTMKLPKAIFMLPLLLLIALVASSPEEAMGSSILGGRPEQHPKRNDVTEGFYPFRSGSI